MPIPAKAQVSDGALSGSITDALGAAMPNVELSLANMATGAATVIMTNACGFYAAPHLRPSTYDMAVRLLVRGPQRAAQVCEC